MKEQDQDELCSWCLRTPHCKIARKLYERLKHLCPSDQVVKEYEEFCNWDDPRR